MTDQTNENYFNALYEADFGLTETLANEAVKNAEGAGKKLGELFAQMTDDQRDNELGHATDFGDNLHENAFVTEINTGNYEGDDNEVDAARCRYIAAVAFEHSTELRKTFKQGRNEHVHPTFQNIINQITGAA